MKPEGGWEGEFDTGVLFTGSGGGADIGIGKGYVGASEYPTKSMAGLEGKGMQYTAHSNIAGGKVEMNRDGEVIGGGVTVGVGYNIGGAGTETEAFTVRGFARSIFGGE